MAITIAETGGGGDGSNTNTVPITMPSTLEGRMVIVLSTDRDGTMTFGWPTSPAWTLVVEEEGITTCAVSIYYRDLDGTEGSSINVTLGRSENYSYVWHRYTGHDTGTAPVAATSTTGTSATPDPPNCNPGTSASRLWVAAMAGDNGSKTIDSFPSSYTDGRVHRDYNDFTAAVPTSAICAKTLTASSDDPETFGISVSDQWNSASFAIVPAAASSIIPQGTNRGILRGLGRGIS